MNEIRVLLVEGDSAETGFIRDALSELEEQTRGGLWVHCRLTHLERAEDAALVLESEPPDVVLFNPALQETRGLETFQALRDAAPSVPLIALLESGDEGLGRRMLRQGAQDFVLKSEIDCEPLARAMLNSIERQRFLRAAEASSTTDSETGFSNSDGFNALGTRDLRLASQSGCTLTLVLAEIDDLLDVDQACGREAAHNLVVEAGNVIRAAAGSALVGRIALGRFALLAWEPTPEPLIARIQQEVQEGYHAFAFVFGNASTGDAGATTLEDLMQTAGAVLYENKQAYLNFT